MDTGVPRVFGPVRSRRLGSSLGVNTMPGRVCSYSCIYCQAGRTALLCEARRAFGAPSDLADEVDAALHLAQTKGVPVDYVSLVPAGEPALDANLGKTISAIRRLDVRVAVFTNSSLLWRSDVRDELALADWVSVKVDAVTEPVWRQINRPHRRLSFDRVLEGLERFAREQAGRLVTETMLVGGVNDSAETIDALSLRIAALAPVTAWVGVPIRPPAEPWVCAPGVASFDRALQVFMTRIPEVRPLLGPDTRPWRSVEGGRGRILAMAAVHPLRDADLEELLPGSARARVDELVSEGSLERVVFDGQRFYRTARPRLRRSS
jgi:wyosine [tRNA(Phe)-imidazoG37] synthetase (radical SAM superfamily)